MNTLKRITCMKRAMLLSGISIGIVCQSFGLFLNCPIEDGEIKVIGGRDNKPQENPLSILDWKARLHTGISSSFFIDYITSPLGYIDVEFIDPNTNVKRIEQGATQTNYSSQYTIGFVSRYNLFQFQKNIALAVSAPIAIGFGNAYPSTPNVIGSNGFGNFQVPLMLNLFYGAKSTFDAEDKVGFNLGYGLEFNKIGIVHLGTIYEDKMYNKGWIMPAFSGGIQFYKGKSPVEINVKYGYRKVQDQLVDQNGNRLVGGRRLTRASSFKLSVVYFYK
ncbi:MAG: hypothetical protein P8P81_02975 [Bacteroidia bacterium]|nr:hypothetical protein [Bacteroidia bacterium]